jgi:hypothetical protein
MESLNDFLKNPKVEPIKTLLFEAKIIVRKTDYFVQDEVSDFFPLDTLSPLKKVMHGVKIKPPTCFRIYNREGGGMFRTWVFGDLELNPDKFSVKRIS